MAPQKRNLPLPSSDDDRKDHTHKRIKQGGRPSRQSAGKKARPSGYVDPEDALIRSQFDSASESDEAPEEATSRNDQEPRHKPWAKKKRHSPPPRALSEDPVEVPEPVDGETATDAVLIDQNSTQTNLPNTLSITVNVPPGTSGPMVMNIDLTPYLKSLHLPPTNGSIIQATVVSKPSSKSARKGKGFLNLPAEIRNKIYDLVLVSADRIRFPPHVAEFKCSSNLLATCKQVHYEGAQVLYGENRFLFQRRHNTRGKLWEKEWKVVGWRDIRAFLQTIGPINIANMRRLFLCLEDGHAERGDYSEKHRLVNDEHLMAALKHLAANSNLRTLNISLTPRKRVTTSDVRFLENLRAIKADRVAFVRHPERNASSYTYTAYWGRDTPATNMDDSVMKKTIQKMERAEKLYPTLEDPALDTDT